MNQTQFTEAMLNRKRYSVAEESLIENTFKDREDLLVLLRKFLLQGELSVSELASLKATTDNPDVLAVVRKAVVHTLDKGADAYTCIDMFSPLDLDPTPKDHAELIIQSRQMAEDYLNQRFDVLAGIKAEGKQIIFDDLVKGGYVSFITRKFLLTHIEKELFNFLFLKANLDKETIEEMLKRQKANSTK